MFDLGATELLVIGIVAIIVVGPKELPKMLRAFGQFVAKMRGMAREFQSMFEEAARDTGMDDMAKSVSDVKNFSVADSVNEAINPISKEASELEAELRAEIPDEPSSSANTEPDFDPIEAGNKAAAAAEEKPAPAKKKKSTAKAKAKKAKAAG